MPIPEALIEMEVSSVLLCCLLLLSFVYLAFLFQKRDSGSRRTDCSALRTYPLIGNLPHFIKNRRRIIEWTTELTTASPAGTVTVTPVVVTADPSNVEHVLKSNSANYIKGKDIIAALHDFLGDGIFNANGELWRLQRKTASFEFNTKSLRAFVADSVRHEAVTRLLPFLRSASASKRVVDLQDVLERFAFDNVCVLVFDHDPRCLNAAETHESDENTKFFHVFEEAGQLSLDRIEIGLPFVWRFKKWLSFGSERRLRESVSFVQEFVTRLVRARKTSESPGSDLLSRFLDSGKHSDELLRDILINFVLAGRETTPSALTWFFWVLRLRPDIVEKIRNEIKLIRARFNNVGEEIFSLEELREMHYLHAALSESMRLHPPVPLLGKWCAADDVLPDGTRVRRGWHVMYSAYAMGRMESIWGKDCTEMRPERWLDEGGSFRPASPFKYPVFLAGPRMCLGKDMAYIQMKAVVACILERFEVEVVGQCGQYQLSMTMRMKGGLPVRVTERKP